MSPSNQQPRAAKPHDQITKNNTDHISRCYPELGEFPAVDPGSAVDRGDDGAPFPPPSLNPPRWLVMAGVVIGRTRKSG
jgi:hypothetical protein